MSAEHAVLSSYYRNNILHLFMLPSLLAGAIMHHRSISFTQLLAYIEQLYPLLRAELFLYVSSLHTYCHSLLQHLSAQGLIELKDELYRAPPQQSRQYFMLSLLAHNAEDTLQRYAIVLNLILRPGPISRVELEKDAHQLAQRLLNLHGIVAPEYYDKGLFITLVNALKEAGISQTDSNNMVCSTVKLEQLAQTVNTLLRNDILQSLQSIMPQHSAP
jgi:glycerol-3-phosphate O-acyltransferase